MAPASSSRRRRLKGGGGLRTDELGPHRANFFAPEPLEFVVDGVWIGYGLGLNKVEASATPSLQARHPLDHSWPISR